MNASTSDAAAATRAGVVAVTTAKNPARNRIGWTSDAASIRVWFDRETP